VAVVASAGGRARGDDAAADPAGDAFRQATRLVADGDLAGAQAAFEAVVDLDPAGPWADDALSEAAAAAERRGDLAGSLRLWRRVLAEHPSSRQARRARAKVTALERAIGEGGRWLDVAVEHEAILRAAVGQTDPAPQLRALEALVAEHPDYPRVHDARMWIGETWLRRGYPRRAIDVFRDARARAPDADARWRAGKALGDAEAAAGDLDAADRTYRSLYGEGDALADRALDHARRELDKMRLRARLVIAAWFAIGAALILSLLATWRAAGGVRAAVRAVARPPIEVAFFVPVALILLFVALSGNFLVERAVRTILLGGLAITWLTGASLEAARRAGRLRAAIVVAHVLAVVLAVSGIVYLSVMHDRLIDMIVETWSHGHEGR
jgi:tetratricopeptide (TPR) repeat protein